MTLTDEERIALERRRKFLAGDTFSYHISDTGTLERAMLRLFPADDGEAITQEEAEEALCDTEATLHIVRGVMMTDARLELRTKGQLRRLLSALGIKEQS